LKAGIKYFNISELGSPEIMIIWAGVNDHRQDDNKVDRSDFVALDEWN